MSFELESFFQDAVVAGEQLKNMDEVEALATEIKAKLDARYRQGQVVGHWLAKHKPETVDAVRAALEKKGYVVHVDEKNQMSIQ